MKGVSKIKKLISLLLVLGLVLGLAGCSAKKADVSQKEEKPKWPEKEI